jgi:hypothetical protein
MQYEPTVEPSVFDRQSLLLRRHWDLLEGLKLQRNQLPVLICTVLLTAAGFVLNSTRIPSSRIQAIGIGVVLLSISAAGVVVGIIIRKRYQSVNTRIQYLYKRMGLVGQEYFPDADGSLYDATSLFSAAYFVIGFIGVVCAVGVALAPISMPSRPDNATVVNCKCK